MAPTLQRAIWPPRLERDETPEEKARRLQDEARAKKRSEEIDRELAALKERERKAAIAKILLLGQAESGKSTVLKNFHLNFAPKDFEKEAAIWRPVIHLNLVHSVNFLLNFVQSRFSPRRFSTSSFHNRAASSSSPYPGPRPSTDSGRTANTSDFPRMDPEIRQLTMRLTPLREVEETMGRVLSGSAFAERVRTDGFGRYNPARASEVEVPAGYRWKSAIVDYSGGNGDGMGLERCREEMEQARRVLVACREDIVKLWEHRALKAALKVAEIFLEEQSGFFLDQAPRIASEDYRPLPEDILKARVTTVGPEEHVILDETSFTKTWKIYDVGGSRNQRAAWAQFFDDVNMIIFIVSMSSFNQMLAEDDSVNRLTDSFNLWRSISSNKILANIEFALFLNKSDLLKEKLAAGVKFSEYVKGYGSDKPNEPRAVTKYLAEFFSSVYNKHSPKKRKLYIHSTCALDTTATGTVIAKVRDTILAKLLTSSNLL